MPIIYTVFVCLHFCQKLPGQTHNNTSQAIPDFLRKYKQMKAIYKIIRCILSAGEKLF